MDANILIRAVLGMRVAKLIHRYANDVVFLTAEEAFEDAMTYLPQIFERRGLHATARQASQEKLDALRRHVQIIPQEIFDPLGTQARERLRGRDEDDWPYLALALLLNCPIWTEDTDFFGCGVPTWTTDRIEIYLND